MMPVIPLRAFEAAPRVVVVPVAIKRNQIDKLRGHFLPWNARVADWHGKR